jgi:hypothetical protein
MDLSLCALSNAISSDSSTQGPAMMTNFSLLLAKKSGGIMVSNDYTCLFSKFANSLTLQDELGAML